MSREEGELEEDVIFDILSNSRRRNILVYLLQNQEPMTIQELSRKVAARENDIPVDDVTKEQQKRVYVSLYQTHIPNLVDAGLVTQDEEAGTVELEGRVQYVVPYLSENGFEERPWHWYYFGLVAASIGVFGMVILEVSVFGALNLTTVIAAVIVAFGVLTGFYVSATRDQFDGGDSLLLFN